MRALVPWFLAAAACAGSRPSPPTAPPPAPAVAACASPEHRQLDFWVGDWDVVIRARASPTSEAWAEGRGHQRIESILGGCAISETFTADGPPAPWAGRSYSSWQPALGTWRQTWVDDAGGYLAFTGGVEQGVMTLYGEVRTAEGAAAQMRMVFQQVTATSLHWEWQRTTDGWATSTVMMIIDYTRRPTRGPR